MYACAVVLVYLGYRVRVPRESGWDMSAVILATFTAVFSSFHPLVGAELEPFSMRSAIRLASPILPAAAISLVCECLSDKGAAKYRIDEVVVFMPDHHPDKGSDIRRSLDN